MPIAYCVRSAPANDLAVSECHYVITKPGGVTYGEPFAVVGLNADKTPLRLGSNIQFDISPVPLGAVVSRAKLVMTADASDADPFSARIWRYRDATSPNLDSVQTTIHQHFKWLARARDTASTELAVTAITGTFDHLLSAPIRGTTAAGQVLILSTGGNGDLGFVSMWLAKSFTGTYLGTCEAKVYSVAGTSGSYTKGTLLATSSARDTSDIAFIPFLAEFVFTFPSPIAVTSGQILLVEVSFTPEPDLLDTYVVGGNTGFASPPDNALLFGPSMQAMDESVYANGWEQSNGNGDQYPFPETTELFAMPTFVADTQYEFGDAAYSPDVELTNFTQWVQDGLDGRGSSNRLSFSFQPGIPGLDADVPTSGEERRWRSGDHTTPQVVDGTSYFGMVLVVEYAGAGVRPFPSRARPAVGHGEITARAAVAPLLQPCARPAVLHGEIAARPAASSPAVPRTRSTVAHREIHARPAVNAPAEARGRPAVGHGEITARPAVRAPAEPRLRPAVRATEEERARPAIHTDDPRARPAVRHFPAGPRRS